jgi:Flp pilus assembly pilin Flp
MPLSATASAVRRFARAETGVAGVEFAMLAGPLLGAIVVTAVLGLHHQAQAVLNHATQQMVEELGRSRFKPPPTPPALRRRACELIAPNAACPSSLVVELRPLQAVAGGASAVKGDVVEPGVGNDVMVLVLRADGPFTIVMGGVTPPLQGAALVRRP